MKPELTIRRVLFATDLSPICESAFRYAADVANHFKARLYLLHVLPGSAAPRADARLSSDARSAKHRAESEMRRLREQLLMSHDDYMMAVVSGQPASRIVEKAREVAADLIVLGVRDPGRHAGGRAVDVARKVCESSPCPVTCVPCGMQDPGPAVAVGSLRAAESQRLPGHPVNN
jgi:nucleotide-binding universal stress UspA family protein